MTWQLGRLVGLALTLTCRYWEPMYWRYLLLSVVCWCHVPRCLKPSDLMDEVLETRWLASFDAVH